MPPEKTHRSGVRRYTRRVGRGPHPTDTTLFAASETPALRRACADLSWLLSRGYAENSALKLTGDRYRLRHRQRTAVGRGACADGALAHRTTTRVEPSGLSGRHVAVDAFNALIIVESALGGAPIFRGRDRALRDLASVHGSYRRVEATHTAIAALVGVLVTAAPEVVTWYVDRPVSNSGRLASWLRDAAPEGIGWEVETPFDADAAVIASGAVAASSDAAVLDRVSAWFDLSSTAVAASAPQAWIVELVDPGGA